MRVLGVKHKPKLIMNKEILHREYEGLCEAFGIHSSLWDQLHCNFSRYFACPENKEAIIGEYLTWKCFVQRAKKYGVAYYLGIDEFLKAYADYVNSQLK
jgi:hypothetical protein